MWDGRPPWDVTEAEEVDLGKGTNVWRFRPLPIRFDGPSICVAQEGTVQIRHKEMQTTSDVVQMHDCFGHMKMKLTLV